MLFLSMYNFHRILCHGFWNKIDCYDWDISMYGLREFKNMKYNKVATTGTIIKVCRIFANTKIYASILTLSWINLDASLLLGRSEHGNSFGHLCKQSPSARGKKQNNQKDHARKRIHGILITRLKNLPILIDCLCNIKRGDHFRNDDPCGCDCDVFPRTDSSGNNQKKKPYQLHVGCYRINGGAYRPKPKAATEGSRMAGFKEPSPLRNRSGLNLNGSGYISSSWRIALIRTLSEFY